MEVLIKAGQLLLSLSILILLHELGHFFFARLFNTRVDKFYLFFNPWFSIFKIKRGDTEYGLGWLPLGGYCKIAGMIDESFDKEQLSKPPQPYEFRSKPTWQRLFIMLGGVMVNFLTAIFIFIFTLFIWGQTFLPNDNVSYGIAVDSLAIEAGFQEGDKIISLDNNKVKYFDDIIHDILLSTPETIQVERDGKTIDIPFSEAIISKLIKNKNSFFITYRTPFIIDSILPDSEADKSELIKNDRIIGVGNISTAFYHEFRREIVNYSEKKVDLKILRGNDTLAIAVNVPDLSANPIGILGVPNNELFKFEKVKYSFFSAIPAGIDKGFSTLGDYIKQFKLIFSKETEGYKEIGGFGAIANIFPSQWNWEAFWNLTAFLSIILAFMNVLPIPALDGGHVLFLIYEMITGRKPSDKFMEYAQMIGLALVLGLVLYANGNDVFKWLSK